MSWRYRYDAMRNARSLREGLIDDIFTLECQVLKLRSDLTVEQAKIMKANLDSYYEKFVKNQLPIMYSCTHLRDESSKYLRDGELCNIMDIGEKVQNKVIHIKTILNEVLDTESNRSNSVKDTKDKSVSSVELDALLVVCGNIQQKVTSLLANSNESSKTADLTEPVEQSNAIVDLCELFETRGSLISQIESLEKEEVDNAAEAASLNDRLTQINDSFTSTQTKIESLVRGAEAQHKQLEIGKKIRQKVCTLREQLEEISKSSNSFNSNILEALIGVQEVLRIQINSLETRVDIDNEAEIVALSERLLYIEDLFTSNQVQIEKLVRGTDDEKKQLEIGELIHKEIRSLRERMFDESMFLKLRKIFD